MRTVADKDELMVDCVQQDGILSSIRQQNVKILREIELIDLLDWTGRPLPC